MDKTMKKLILSFTFLSISLIIFGQTASNIILFDKSAKIWGFKIDNYMRFTPSIEDFNAIDSLAANFVKNNSDSLTFIKKPINNYHSYYKQVYGLINKEGDKVLFVNCFCNVKRHDYWKRETISVKGGGSCYFSFKVRLNDSSFYDLHVNAPK